MKSRTAGILVMALIVIIAVFCITGFKGKPKEVYLEDMRVKLYRMEAHGMTSVMAIL